MEKTCFFIGHRYGSVDYDRLTEEIERHIVEYGVDTFVVGYCGFFDLMATVHVREAKEKYPHIKLYRLLPYTAKEHRPVKSEAYDGDIFSDGLEEASDCSAVVQAKRRMIDRSGYLIANAWKPGSDSVKLVEYARRKKHIQVTNLPETE